MPTFQILLHRIDLDGPIRVTPSVGVRSEVRILTDEQLQERLTLLIPTEADKVFASLSHGRGEHLLRFPAAQWPVLWNTPEAFFRYWCPDGLAA